MSFIKLEFRDAMVYCEVNSLTEGFLSPDDLPLYFQNLNINGSVILDSVPVHIGTWNIRSNIRDQIFRVVTKRNIILKELKYDYSAERLYLYEFWDYFTRTNKELIGLVLGAGNGLWGEWVRGVVDNNIRCFLVEGAREVFNELKDAYNHNENVTCMNHLVSIDGADYDFYDTKMSGFGTISAEFIEKNPETIDYEVERRKTKKFSDLLNEIGQINWIRFDVEGLDYELIMSLDFSKFGYLKMVQYEHWNLDPEKKKTIENKFLSEGYNLLDFNIDSVFIKR